MWPRKRPYHLAFLSDEEFDKTRLLRRLGYNLEQSSSPDCPPASGAQKKNSLVSLSEDHEIQNLDVDPGSVCQRPGTNHGIRKLGKGNASRLCSTCSSILREDFFVEYMRKEWLPVSFTNGCPLCFFFQKKVLRVLGFFRNNSWLLSTYYVSKVGLSNARLECKGLDCSSVANFELFTKGEVCFPQIIKVEAYFADITPNSKLDRIYRQISEPSSPAAIQLICDWMHNCQNFHDHCVMAADLPLPTRVIDVRGEYLRVCEAGSSLLGERYITLSHCWGDGQFWKTTSKTFKQMKDGFELQRLSPVFQDAVAVTRKLGVSYLWIDALCIVQDSSEDWKRECTKMGDYYHNAYVTVSALSSGNSFQSFLQRRDSSAEILGTGVWMRPSLPKYDEVFNEAPLILRGWCLQERLFSPRLVHFAQYEMIWECQSCIERDSTWGRYSPGSTVSQTNGIKWKQLDLSNRSAISGYGSYNMWLELVQLFSRRKLTYATDRLPAISSLASAFGSRFKAIYLAGIWDDDLQGLAWTREDEETRIYHSGQGWTELSQCTPSWSWVGLRESVVYRYLNKKRIPSADDPKLVGSAIHYQGQDPYGAISHGIITLDVLTARVLLAHKTQKYRQKKLCGTYADVYSYTDSFKSWDSLQGVATAFLDQDQSHEMRLQDCMAVLLGRRWSESGQITLFMLVQPQDDEPKLHKRIGAGYTLASCTYGQDHMFKLAVRQQIVLG